MSYRSKCVQCGKDFILTDNEVDFYKRKNLQLPKRCKECRELNKKSKGSNSNKTAYTKRTQDYGVSDSKRPAYRIASVIAVIAVLVVALIPMLTGGNGDVPYTPAETGQITALTGETTVSTVLSSEAFSEITSLFTENTEDNEIIGETDVPISEVMTETEPPAVVTDETTAVTTITSEAEQAEYHFRKESYLNEHYEKHGIEMGFASAEEYEKAASAVITNPDALSKREKEDNDYVYYIEETNEFVILSTDGYIRTYFYPDRGKAYYDKQ